MVGNLCKCKNSKFTKLFLTHFGLKVQKKFKKFWRKTRKIESAYIVELITF